MKRCPKCNQTKEYSDFHKNRSKNDGLASTCKSCKKIIDRKYLEENREKRTKYKREYQRMKMNTDIRWKLKHNLRRRNTKAFELAGFNYTYSNEYLLGADIDTVIKHIESQFRGGMSWENYPEWHIDHIIPFSVAKNEEDIIRLCHYSNIQPLWAEENQHKYNKLDWTPDS